MDFTKFIESGDMAGLKKYKEDGGDINLVFLLFIESFKSINLMIFQFLYFNPFGI